MRLDYGTKLKSDHTAHAGEIERLLEPLDVTIPTEPSAEALSQLAALTRLSRGVRRSICPDGDLDAHGSDREVRRANAREFARCTSSRKGACRCCASTWSEPSRCAGPASADTERRRLAHGTLRRPIRRHPYPYLHLLRRQREAVGQAVAARADEPLLTTAARVVSRVPSRVVMMTDACLRAAFVARARPVGARHVGAGRLCRRLDSLDADGKADGPARCRSDGRGAEALHAGSRLGHEPERVRRDRPALLLERHVPFLTSSGS